VIVAEARRVVDAPISDEDAYAALREEFQLETRRQRGFVGPLLSLDEILRLELQHLPEETSQGHLLRYRHNLLCRLEAANVEGQFRLFDLLPATHFRRASCRLTKQTLFRMLKITKKLPQHMLGGDAPNDVWVQCVKCEKWRRQDANVSEADFVQNTEWSCSDNVWDPLRASSEAADETGESEDAAAIK